MAETTVVKKGKSPVFWMIVTSILWLVILGLCSGGTLAIISSNQRAKEALEREIRIVFGMQEIQNELECSGEVNECLREKEELNNQIDDLHDKIEKQQVIIDFLEEQQQEDKTTPTSTPSSTPTEEPEI